MKRFVSYPVYVFLFFLSSNSLFALQASLAPADSTRKTELKAYFLLKAALDTDPLDLQNYREAVQFTQTLQQFSEQLTPLVGQLSSQQQKSFNQAMQHAYAGNIDAAISSFRQILSSPNLPKPNALMEALHQQLSLLFSLKGAYEQAISHQHQLLDLALRTNNVSLQAKTYLRLGSLSCLNGSFEEGERYLLQQALPMLSRLKNKAGVIDCYHALAQAYYNHEQYSQSKWFYLQALSVAKQQANAKGIITSKVALGQFKFDLSELEAAISDWKSAEKTAIHAHELPVLLQLKFNLMQAYRALGLTDLAQSYQQEFLQLKDVLQNPLPQ